MPQRTGYKHGQFCWVDLVAHDMLAAEQMYGQLFGWECTMADTQDGLPYAHFTLEGKAVAGIAQMSDEIKAAGMPPMWNSYLNVEEIEGVAERVEELGGSIAVPVRKLSEAGSLAFLTDPAGGQVGLWQRNQHLGASVVNELNTFLWNELATRDIEAATTFYSELLGWDFAETGFYRLGDSGQIASASKYLFIKSGGRDNGAIIEMTDTDRWGEIPPHWSVYFRVPDVDAFLKRTEGLGGRIQAAFDCPIARMAVVADAQGAVFNVVQYEQQK